MGLSNPLPLDFMLRQQGMFLSLVSNYLLAFCYFKAVINTWL